MAAVVEAVNAAGATVTLSRSAVVVAAVEVPTAVRGVTAVEVAAAAEDEVAIATAPVEEANVELMAAGGILVSSDMAAAAAAAAAAAEVVEAAVAVEGAVVVAAASVSSGGLGGGVAKPDQHVDGELLLDVTLLAQSRPTSTSTRVDHVVSHGDSERVGDDTIGSSFK